LNAELDAFEFTIVLSSAATITGFGFAVSGPAPPTYIDYIVTYQTTANGAPGTTDVITQRHNIGYDAMTATPSTITANVNLHAHIKGTLRNGSTAGTLSARVRSSAANNILSSNVAVGDVVLIEQWLIHGRWNESGRSTGTRSGARLCDDYLARQ